MGRKVVHGGETRNRIGADTRAKKHSRYMKRETRGETRGTGQHRRGALPNSPSKKNACGTHFFSFPSFLHSFPFFFPSLFYLFSKYSLLIFHPLSPFLRGAPCSTTPKCQPVCIVSYTLALSHSSYAYKHTQTIPISESSYPSVTKSVAAAVILSQPI